MHAPFTSTKLRWLALPALLLTFSALAKPEMHLTHADAVGAAIAKPAPQYSNVARQLKLQGTVQVNVSIGEDGKVDHVASVSGNPVLFHCVEDALKEWKFKPFSENGRPAKAVAAMSFSFKRQGSPE